MDAAASIPTGPSARSRTLTRGPRTSLLCCFHASRASLAASMMSRCAAWDLWPNCLHKPGQEYLLRLRAQLASSLAHVGGVDILGDRPSRRIELRGVPLHLSPSCNAGLLTSAYSADSPTAPLPVQRRVSHAPLVPSRFSEHNCKDEDRSDCADRCRRRPTTRCR